MLTGNISSISGNDVKKAIPNAIRLSADEQLTAGRLMEKTGLTFVESKHVGAEYIDQFGRTYDAMGTLRASQHWMVFTLH